MEATFSMFSDQRSRILQKSLAYGAEPPARQPLTEKYRPWMLGQMVGQGAAVWRLMQFLEAPFPTSFLFEGETGTGKTTAARALANELGVDRNWGLHEISSGDMDAEQVRESLRSLRFAAPGSGWKLIVADEADSMSPKAKALWLSALESIPDRSVIVFTTNHPKRFDQRFLDRCERVQFESNASLILQDAQTLFDQIWYAEGIKGSPPRVSDVNGIIKAGMVSFRRVIRAIENAKAGQLTVKRQLPETIVASLPEPSSKSEKWRVAGLKAAATRKARQLAKEASCG